ncbi:MAG: hypothetical protein M5U26_29020 [Planctomycetota bacterium]|nr:hypothetical protein [Planctomycetota bacterium]
MPTVTLKNVARQNVRVRASISASWVFGLVIKSGVKDLPEVHEAVALPLAERILKPGECYSVELPPLRELKLVRNGKFFIRAIYKQPKPEYADALDLWEPVLSNEIVVERNEPPIGVGTIENAEQWAMEHQTTTSMPTNSTWKGTMRLSFADVSVVEILEREPNQYKGWGIPKGWAVPASDAVGLAFFRKTGVSVVFPVPNALTGSGSDDADDRQAKHEPNMLRLLGFTEDKERIPGNSMDFDWIRELDGARLHYRYVVTKSQTFLFEVWEEEYAASKPEMDQFIKAVSQPPSRLEP